MNRWLRWTRTRAVTRFTTSSGVRARSGSHRRHPPRRRNRTWTPNERHEILASRARATSTPDLTIWTPPLGRPGIDRACDRTAREPSPRRTLADPSEPCSHGRSRRTRVSRGGSRPPGIGAHEKASLARPGSAPWTLPRSRPCPPCQSTHKTVASSLRARPVASRARSAIARTASRG
jgi:hypothetical protein